VERIGRPIPWPVVALIGFLAGLAAYLASDGRTDVLVALVAGLALGAGVAGFGPVLTTWWALRCWRTALGVANLAPCEQPPPLVLRRVVPIGQTQRSDDLAVTLLTLESYEASFTVTGLLQWRAEPGSEADAPDLAFEAGDDRGGRYTGLASGGGGPGQWRLEYRFVPALDPGARELRLEAAECRWRRFEPGEPGQRVRRTTPGPWRFTVALPAEPEVIR
jgi:hypothetical protein